ncbi:hypothetical protein N7470_006513, partial [Penicillium chermesinum]
DWQLNHGSLLKLVRTQDEHTVLSQPVGCFPTRFPRARFEEAQGIQRIYNKLYCAISEDEDWIFDAVQDLISTEPLAAVLWGIYQSVKKDGFVQPASLGIFRSDYMLQAQEGGINEDKLAGCTLKQVEFNSFSCSGASHANKVADMHRFLARTGHYDTEDTKFDHASLPPNENIESLVSSISAAHALYGAARSKLAKQTAPGLTCCNQFNVADERPLEYALWNKDDPVPAHRLEFGPDVLDYTWLTESRELLFKPPWLDSASPFEISVVYMRAGYEAREYDKTGREAREKLEKSRAIKCPSILCHLATFKKVQQALTVPGALERFLTDSEAAAIRPTFAAIYPLDDSFEGLQARRFACDPKRATRYILKPSLEGGGHNIYGSDVPDFLRSVPERQWSTYVLMERIDPPISSNLLMSPAGVAEGDVVSELGILGTCLWRTSEVARGRCEMLDNSVAGWTFKTKYSEVDEMSVVKGYGCFDSPSLVEA